MTVCPAFGPTPPLTVAATESFKARYEIIFPFPSSPKKPPIITVVVNFIISLLDKSYIYSFNIIGQNVLNDFDMSLLLS